MKLVLDIETNSTASKIWLVVTKNLDNGERQCHTNVETLKPLLERCEQVIGHNLIAFDAYHLMKLWGVTIPIAKMIDTLVLSRLYKPDLEGGHSLANWGKMLRFAKQEYNEFDNPDLETLKTYCENDVELTAKLYSHLTGVLNRMKFSQQCQDLEHLVAYYVNEQVVHGFKVDEPKLFGLQAELTDKLGALEKQLQSVFRPTIIELKTKTKVIPFNPGSRKQIAERLMELGWQPSEHTDKGNIIVDEDVLGTIDMPEAKLLQEYFMLQKRVSQIAQWVQYLGEDGRVHGKVISNGAVTGRMTHHSPNMAQVPKASPKVPYGRECREIFTVPAGYKLVGVDASGLELRMLAHYMKDDGYIHEILNGDVHSKNQAAAGLQTRDQAKTFIYALLYGAGAEKIGSIAGGGAEQGGKLIESFLRNTPALKDLKDTVTTLAAKGTIKGLDGRRLYVRSPHKALNTLLQGAGAILMKQSLILFHEGLTREGLCAKVVCNVHDEFQIEALEKDAEAVGKLAVRSIEEAGKLLGLRCPVTGEYRVGQNWAETH